MQVENSLIPNAGKGVFATRNYKEGEIVGEYEGYILKPSEPIPKGLEQYLYCNTNEVTIIPYPTTVCQFINDAIDVEGTSMAILTELWSGNNMKRKNIQSKIKFFLNRREGAVLYVDPDTCMESDYNVDWYEDLSTNQVFVKCIRDIQEGEELYIAYGWRYWSEFVMKFIREYRKGVVEKYVSSL